MRFTYRLVHEEGTFVAECLESEVAGEGKSEAAAIASLRTMLEERMFRPDAIAPPSKPITGGKIELAPAMTESSESDLGGPGDVQPRRHSMR